MKFILLTHQRELDKASNTGKLVRDILGDAVDIIIWKRKEPDLRLVDLLENGRCMLLYPDNINHNQLTEYHILPDYVVILDATWQQARKMYNQSPYLKSAQKISIIPESPSQFKLRRNQIQGGLSTVECVIHLIQQVGETKLSLKLEQAFILFNRNEA